MCPLCQARGYSMYESSLSSRRICSQMGRDSQRTRKYGPFQWVVNATGNNEAGWEERRRREGAGKAAVSARDSREGCLTRSYAEQERSEPGGAWGARARSSVRPAVELKSCPNMLTAAHRASLPGLVTGVSAHLTLRPPGLFSTLIRHSLQLLRCGRTGPPHRPVPANHR